MLWQDAPPAVRSAFLASAGLLVTLLCCLLQHRRLVRDCHQSLLKRGGSTNGKIRSMLRFTVLSQVYRCSNGLKTTIFPMAFLYGKRRQLPMVHSIHREGLILSCTCKYFPWLLIVVCVQHQHSAFYGNLSVDHVLCLILMAAFAAWLVFAPANRYLLFTPYQFFQQFFVPKHCQLLKSLLTRFFHFWFRYPFVSHAPTIRKRSLLGDWPNLKLLQKNKPWDVLYKFTSYLKLTYILIVVVAAAMADYRVCRNSWMKLSCEIMVTVPEGLSSCATEDMLITLPWLVLQASQKVSPVWLSGVNPDLAASSRENLLGCCSRFCMLDVVPDAKQAESKQWII